jgi:hypothetical protein
MNKKKLLISAALMTILILPSASFATGNGAPKGEHYNLNILGKSKTMTADMTDSSGHSIFVNLEGKTKINLQQGDDFKVIDANGTDGNGATFQLPNPDPDGDGKTVYSVYVRALGKPNGKATMTNCATQLTTDPITNIVTTEEVCSLNNITVTRGKGKSSFSNVSSELLYIYADINNDGYTERLSLFDPRLQDYFWDYDNKGMRHIQLRFYPISTTVN